MPVPAALVPTLGLFSTIMLVVGGVIGSGIFRKPAVMAAQLGSPESLLLVWVLAGVITLCGALTNAEVASRIPETGGQYVYFRHMYGPGVAFLYGWALFAIIQCGSIAAVAYVFAEYASSFCALPGVEPELAVWSFHLPLIGDVVPFADFGTKALAASLILLLTGVNYLGVRFGALVQNVFTVAKIVAMLGLVLGAFLLPSGGWPAPPVAGSPGIHLTGLAWLTAMAAALQGAFWAYDGWNKITYIAGEVKSPRRTIPLGLLWGMVIVTGVYLLMNLAYLWVLPVEAMAQSKLVAADVANQILPHGARWVSALVMVSTFGTTSAIILATARVYFSMARAHAAPAFLGRIHPRYQTPAASLVAQGGWSVALLFSGTFDTLTDALIFVSWIFYAAGAYGLFILRRETAGQPASAGQYRVPGYPVVPGMFVAFAVMFLVLTAYNDLTVYREALAAGRPAMLHSLFGVFLTAAGLPLYFVFRRRSDGPAD